jgi:hypothetical protein
METDPAAPPDAVPEVRDTDPLPPPLDEPDAMVKAPLSAVLDAADSRVSDPLAQPSALDPLAICTEPPDEVSPAPPVMLT